jgi:lipoprotein signal peptidase
MRCLVTADKHVKNIRAIAKQILGKRIPAAMVTHSTVEVVLYYNNGKGFSLRFNIRGLNFLVISLGR